jgi:hypothetical protein
MLKRPRNPRNCVVCDVRLRRNNHQTCGSALCYAAATLHPHIRDPLRRIKEKKPPFFATLKQTEDKNWRDIATHAARHTHILASESEIHKAMAEGFAIDSTHWQIRDKYLSNDVRGIDNPEIQEAVWGYLSRRRVCWKAVAHEDGQASLVIRLRPDETVSEYIRTHLTGSSRSEEMFEIFYAWRCTCPQRVELEFKTIDDLPQGYGYHHACIHCHAAPLEVIPYDESEDYDEDE